VVREQLGQQARPQRPGDAEICRGGTVVADDQVALAQPHVELVGGCELVVADGVERVDERADALDVDVVPRVVPGVGRCRHGGTVLFRGNHCTENAGVGYTDTYKNQTLVTDTRRDMEPMLPFLADERSRQLRRDANLVRNARALRRRGLVRRWCSRS
jgi:hypothetical protein